MSQNHLHKEKSPYLLQHKDNPVNWYAWNHDAFAAAKSQNKIIFLSIGYSTCYWCHMMEKDSFEHQDVAQVLNRDFVAIKVDREEHPDVDQIYMDAVMGLTGRGGWPLTVFLTPDLKPFYGGTFFWKPQFLQILDQIQKHWQNDPQKILKSSAEITNVLNNHSFEKSDGEISPEVYDKALTILEKNFDSFSGGFGTAPKFPQPSRLFFLKEAYLFKKDESALAMLEKTLTEMAHGGIYDHIGGGFHRYSTDERWFVPHFEKMLYDNAELAQIYLDVFKITKKQMYADVASEILDYVLRDMTSRDGGFYSAEDAGEVNKEGDFYVWTENELKTALTDSEFEKIKNVFGIVQTGNWEEQKNIFYLPKTSSWQMRQECKSLLNKLFLLREKRVRPHCDDKILTSWNGLMIAAMAKGYQILGDKKYLQAAQKAAHFLKDNLYKNKILLRRYRDGEAKFDGTLQDYSYLIYGLLELFQSDFDTTWLEWILELQAEQDQLFWDQKNNGYFFGQIQQNDLVIQKKDFYDGALPSANSVSLANLYKIYHFTYEQKWQEQSQKLLKAMSATIIKNPVAVSFALSSLTFKWQDVREIVMTVSQKNDLPLAWLDYFWRECFDPKVLWVKSSDDVFETHLTKDKVSKEGKATLYICQNQSCLKPVFTLEDAKELLKKY